MKRREADATSERSAAEGGDGLRGVVVKDCGGDGVGT